MFSSFASRKERRENLHRLRNGGILSMVFILRYLVKFPEIGLRNTVSKLYSCDRQDRAMTRGASGSRLP